MHACQDALFSCRVGNASANAQSTDVNANVAIDIFMDSNSGASTVTTQAKHEVMVWFAMYGPATQPIGYNSGAGPIRNTQTINGTRL